MEQNKWVLGGKKTGKPLSSKGKVSFLIYKDKKEFEWNDAPSLFHKKFTPGVSSLTLLVMIDNSAAQSSTQIWNTLFTKIHNITWDNKTCALIVKTYFAIISKNECEAMFPVKILCNLKQ